MSKRILIKLSGEALSSGKNKKLAIDPKIVNKLVDQIKRIKEKGIQVGIVVGGGNFWRGAAAEKNGMGRNKADYIGMLATVMNALSLQASFENKNVKANVQSSLVMDPKVAENYISEKANKYLDNDHVVIFAGGTGRPYFTTDTTSALVASEIGAPTILMGKNGVDGVYDSDPKLNKNAKHFATLKYDDIVTKKLLVMDATAATMAEQNNIEILVFDITEEDALIRAINGDIKMTKVKN